MDRQLDGLTNLWTDGQIRWMDRQMDGWMEGWTDGWTDGRTDGWMVHRGYMDGLMVDAELIDK